MPEPTYEELKARLAELEKQGATRRTGSLEFRVSEKGGVSVYGLGRFPVTLSASSSRRTKINSSSKRSRVARVFSALLRVKFTAEIADRAKKISRSRRGKPRLY